MRTGMALDIEGKIYRVGKTQHVKPGKGGAYVQVRRGWLWNWSCRAGADMEAGRLRRS